jgi:hypothetical protein
LKLLVAVGFAFTAVFNPPPTFSAGNGVVEQQLGVAEASNEGQLAIKKFEVATGLAVSLFAAEPMLANPVSFTTDAQGRWYIAETFRVYTGVPDASEHLDWVENHRWFNPVVPSPRSRVSRAGAEQI